MDKSPKSAEDATRKRQTTRRFICCWGIGGGLLFVIFGRSWLVNGLPVHWVGYLFILVSILGFAGVNVFVGGPLDLRLDKTAQPHSPPLPAQVHADNPKCGKLKEDLATQPEPQILPVERFFDGNDDPGSIGRNLTDHPGIAAFRDILTGLLQRPGIEAVYIQIAELDPGEGSWPFSDTAFVVGNISLDELRNLLTPLGPDEIRVAETSEIPAPISQKHRAPVFVV